MSNLKQQIKNFLNENGNIENGSESDYSAEIDRQLNLIKDSNKTLGLSLIQYIEEVNYKTSLGHSNESIELMKDARLRFEVSQAVSAAKYGTHSI